MKMNIPPGTSPLESQAAGHNIISTNGKLGMLQCQDGTILKASKAPPRRDVERQFYQTVFAKDQRDPLLLQLQPLIPKFFGVLNNPASNGVFLRLENLAWKFKYPSVMDVKMGIKIYDPYDPNKIPFFLKKYPPQGRVGFLICGIKHHDSNPETYPNFDKFFFRELDEHDVAEKGLKIFFTQHGHICPIIVNNVLSRLQNIADFHSCQNKWSFYRSSLLFVCEGDPSCYPCKTATQYANRSQENDLENYTVNSSEQSNGTIQNETQCDNVVSQSNAPLTKEETRNIPSVPQTACETLESSFYSSYSHLLDLRQIDFSRVYEKTDENFRDGLIKLIGHIEKLKQSCDDFI